jgi:hypothetical protein
MCRGGGLEGGREREREGTGQKNGAVEASGGRTLSDRESWAVKSTGWRRDKGALLPGNLPNGRVRGWEELRIAAM